MNEFEKLITDEYVKNHAANLLKENYDTANIIGDIADPHDVLKNEMSVSARNRFVYLALVRYHQCLAAHLKESGISLPDFATLTGMHGE